MGRPLTSDSGPSSLISVTPDPTQSPQPPGRAASRADWIGKGCGFEVLPIEEGQGWPNTLLPGVTIQLPKHYLIRGTVGTAASVTRKDQTH